MRTIDISRAGRGLLLGITGLAAAAGAGCTEQSALAHSAVTTVAAAGASNPTAAEDSRTGRSYVAWVGTHGDEKNVYLAVSSDGGTSFAPPVRVNDRPGDAAPHEQAPAQVAVGPEGSVYVVWQNNTPLEGRRFPASDLRFARSTDGGRTFEPAVTVNDDAGGVPSSHTFHNLAVGADGTVYVSWIDSRTRDAYLAAHPEARAAEAAKGGHGSEMKHGAPAAAKAHGDDGLPGPEIRVTRSTDGGRTFEPSVVVDADACPCCRTSLAVGRDGSVYVAWRKVYAGDVRDVVVARAAPGRLAFAAPVRVHADGWVFPGCPHAGPALTVDDQDRLHVAWYTGKEGRQGLWYAVSADHGASFGQPLALLTGDYVPPSQVRLAARGGAVWAAWDDRREQEKTVTLARIEEGTVQERTAVDALRGASPALAAGRPGTLLAWHDGQAVRTLRAGE